MTPDDIREQLAELRDAGDALSRREPGSVVDALGAVLDGWRAPDSRWRRDLEAKLPAAAGFGEANVRAGLELALVGWTGDALRDLVQRELVGSNAALSTGFPVTAVLLAGSIPMPTLLSLIAPLAVGSPVLAKPASRDPVTPALVARSIREVDPELGRCIRIAAFESRDEACTRALLDADCVSAMGSDATIAELRALVVPPRRLVADGHRLSLAAVRVPTAEASCAELAGRLAVDVALWDQLGCLSPIEIYAVGPGADSLASALGDALAELEERLPRGPVGPEIASGIARERDEAELRAAAGRSVRVHASASTAWTVILEDAPKLRPAPAHRFVRVVPVADCDALIAAMRPFRAHLAGVAVEGFAAETPALARALARGGASRICAPGSLQAPPLAWRHAGRGVLAPLARQTDVEIGGS